MASRAELINITDRGILDVAGDRLHRIPNKNKTQANNKIFKSQYMKSTLNGKNINVCNLYGDIHHVPLYDIIREVQLETSSQSCRMHHIVSSTALTRQAHFEKYCQLLNLNKHDTKMAKLFKERTFGRGKVKLDNFILNECGYTFNTYEENKLYALIEIRKHSIPVVYFYNTKYYNKELILTFEHFLHFTKLPTVARQMTNISRSQLTKFMKICLGYHDYDYYNLQYDPLNICQNFYAQHKHIISAIILLPVFQIQAASTSDLSAIEEQEEQIQTTTTSSTPKRKAHRKARFFRFVLSIFS